jgi:regulator of replication initiation timing
LPLFILINFLLTFSKEQAYLRGRINELNRQLIIANDELRELRTEFGKVTSYNEVLAHENDNLRKENEELKSAHKGKRRYQDNKIGDDHQIK